MFYECISTTKQIQNHTIKQKMVNPSFSKQNSPSTYLLKNLLNVQQATCKFRPAGPYLRLVDRRVRRKFRAPVQRGATFPSLFPSRVLERAVFKFSPARFLLFFAYRAARMRAPLSPPRALFLSPRSPAFSSPPRSKSERGRRAEYAGPPYRYLSPELQ